MLNRRQTLKRLLRGAAACMCMGSPVREAEPFPAPKSGPPETTVYRAVNGRPEENLTNVVKLAGGVEKFVGAHDVVLIKPNVQWWNQGAPNLAALVTLVELVMGRPGGFSGEVVLAENCHRGAKPWESLSSGWTQVFVRNSDLAGVGSFNDAAALLKKRFGDRFSVCHWVDVGAGGRRVHSPPEGPGYVYCDGTGGAPEIAFDNGMSGEGFRKTLMTYPVCRTEKGTLVDLKNGIWEKGIHSDRPLTFINLARRAAHCRSGAQGPRQPQSVGREDQEPD